jgi:glycosyltransferase involved in cell wall biosynthesis
MQLDQPKVSVIIPTYNRKQYLDRAINSVLKQTYTNYELIIVDDASTDGTPEFITEKYPDIRLLALQKNRGAGGARNEGINIAQGSFIAFLDSDDEWLPNYLETHVKYFESNPNIILTFCGCTHKYADGTSKKFSCRPWLQYPDLTYHLLFENFISSASIVVVRKESLSKSELFKEDLKICQDKELFLRLLCLGEAVHIPQLMVNKYTHSSNLTNDYHLWIKETFETLDIFFANTLSQPYRHVEIATRSHSAMRLARILWNEKREFFLSLQMLIKAFMISPKYMSQFFWKKVSNRLATD